MQNFKLNNTIEALIGNTPMLRLNNYMRKHNCRAEIYAKLESFNPTGSIKDRAARQIIIDAQEQGLLKKGGTIVEATSGNMGIALAALGAAYGYRVILTMPDTMSAERRSLLKAYGAELVLTDGKHGMKGALDAAEKIAVSVQNAYMPKQFENLSNAKAHYNKTGPEIWVGMNMCIDALVAGVGTGGTISGTGAYLKSMDENIHIAAVEPEASPVLSGGISGKHAIQGIGAGFVPKLLNTAIYDEIMRVGDADAINTMKELAQCEGVLTGISSGAALFAAHELGKRDAYENKRIVVILPDTGERYLSGNMFEKMEENNG